MSKYYHYEDSIEKMCDDYCYFSKMQDMYSFDPDTMCLDCPLNDINKYIKGLKQLIIDKDKKKCSNTLM